LPLETPAAVRGILFDLDGTLIDSRQDITTAINGMRAERTLPPLTAAQVGAMVGEGARVLVRRALPAGSDREELKSALASYLAHYARVCLDATRAFRGVSGMLATLAPSYSLGVLTNKGEELSRRILAGLGLDRHLREVVGGDTLPTRKPNPGGVFLLADRLAIPVEQLLLVGDSDIDAETARAAGCAFALALWDAPPADRGDEMPAAEAPGGAEEGPATEAGAEPGDGGAAYDARARYAAPAAQAVGSETAASAETAGNAAELETATDPETPEKVDDAAANTRQAAIWRLRKPRDLAAALGLTLDAED
jgi:phosphoglycolate phosphatase